MAARILREPSDKPDKVKTEGATTEKAAWGVAALKRRIETRCNTIDLAPDLAQDIGSRRWFRGLGTLLGLGIVAFSFWPDMTAVEAATSMPVDAEIRDEFRSQMILPLALGADSGRHMGASLKVMPLRTAPERPEIQLVATLGRGDSFSRMLQRAGVGQGDAVNVASLVGHVMPIGDVEAGTQFDITLGKREAGDEPRPLDRLEFRARFDLDLVVERHDDRLTLERRAIAVDTTPLRIKGRVGSGLYRSARAAGAPLNAIRDYLNAIDEHVSLESDITAGDEFDIIIAYKRSAKGERQAGELLYAGLESGGKPRLQLLRWGKSNQFFEASGVGRQSTTIHSPVSGRMTSRFGMRRHPILGYRRMHSGVDFAARYGTPIFAVSNGVVSYSGRHGGHGKYVRIEHGGGLGSGYAHMSRISVSSGTRITAGQVIGYVGSTGLSTGPHLHFEVYRGGRKVDPLSVKFLSRPQIDGAELSAFKQRLSGLRSIPVGAALSDIAPDDSAAEQPSREIDRIAGRRERVFSAPDAKAASSLANRPESLFLRN